MTTETELDASVRRVLLGILADGEPYTGIPLVDPETNLLAPPILDAIRGPLEDAITDVETVADAAIPAAQKGAASGVAPLDSGSRVPDANLPTRLGATQLNATFGAIIPITAFGAVPGVDCSSALVAAVAAVQPGGTIWFPSPGASRWVWNSEIVIHKSRITIAGNGAVVSGRLTFGNGSARLDARARVRGLNFVTELNKTAYPVKGYADDSFYIGFDRARGCEVTACEFYGVSKPVWVKPNPAAASHDNSMLDVHHNRFSECDAAMWVDLHATVAATSRGYEATADCSFSDNIVNLSWQYGYYSAGQDGGYVSRNTFFMRNYTHGIAGPDFDVRFAEKVNNVFVGESNWIHVSGNKCFEPGFEGVRLEKVRAYLVSDNLVAWPGQRDLKDAISVTAASPTKSTEWANGSIANNVIVRHTKAAIAVAGDHIDLSAGPNTVLYTASPESYVGAAAWSSVSHYRYDFSGVTQLLPSRIKVAGVASTFAEGYSDRFSRTYLYSAEQHTPWSGRSGSYRSLSITGATDVFAMTDIAGVAGTGGMYGGLVVISAKNGTSSGGRTSTYVLLVTRTADGSAVTVIASGGYVAGANANDPSFTWAVNNNALRATPIGSTSGTFNFSLQAVGNVLIG